MRIEYLACAFALIGSTVGCQSKSTVSHQAIPQGRMSIDMGPPPPGYWKIVGGSVPGWKPEHMPGLRPGPRSPLTWEPLGPRPITGEGWSGGGDASGRVVGIAPHPIDPDICYLAAASGGCWKTVDGGVNWTPLTDELSTTNHGAIAVDPNNPDTLYLGTGEYQTNSKGDGLYKSTDGGVTWQRVLTSVYMGTRCSAIAVDPMNSNNVHLAGSSGYHRSEDSGQTWSETIGGSISSLALDPVNPSNVLIGRKNYGIYRSTDGGLTFDQVTEGLPDDGLGRILIDICDSQPNVVYAAFVDGSSVVGTYKSEDGGQTWFELVNTPDFAYPQAWYDCYIAVDPENPDTVYAGGVSPYYANAGIIRSTDGGNSWTEISLGQNDVQTHPDHHTMAFGPTGVIWEGNDGGIWKSNDRGDNWINCNATLTVTQNYTIGGNPQDNAQMLGGTQDNGSVERVIDDEDWPQVIGGDGGFLAYDFDNPNIKYTTYVYLSVQRWMYGHYTNISGPWGDDPKNFIAPLVMDPNDSHTLLGGTNRVWRTNNADTFADWTAISTSEVAGGGQLNTLAVAVGHSDTIYTGASSGQVWLTTDGANWSKRSNGLPSGQISDLILNPEDPGNAYVTYNRTAAERVLVTYDYGLTWTDVTGDLAYGAAVTALEVDWRHNPPGLYIGTGAGVWSSTDGGDTWIKDENDLPNVNIGDLEIDRERNTLLAGTYGRGAWRATLPPLPCPADVNSDGVVDIDDVFGVIAEWGSCDDCPEDINEDGFVDIDDVFAALADWGPCPQ